MPLVADLSGDMLIEAEENTRQQFIAIEEEERENILEKMF